MKRKIAGLLLLIIGAAAAVLYVGYWVLNPELSQMGLLLARWPLLLVAVPGLVIGYALAFLDDGNA